MITRMNMRPSGWGRGALLALSLGLTAAPALQADDAASAQTELAAAQLDSQRAAARLALATARTAVLEGRWQVAEVEGQRALATLRALPASDAVTDQVLMAEGIVARARAGRSTTVHAPPAPTAPVTQMTPVGSASKVAGDRAPVPAPHTQGSTKPAQSHSSDAGGGAVATDDDFDATPLPFRDQAQLRNDIRDDEVRHLNDVDVARRASLGPDQWVQYPPDWKQKAARRARDYPGGLVARSDGWTDAQGREWYMGVYDVSDLIYIAPDFAPQVQMNPVVAIRTWQDRFAMNFNLAGFGSFAINDPDRLLMLYRYFGGVDDVMWRGPKYSLERQQQLQQMVELLTGEQGQQARVISLPPVQAAP